jgi:hypothetical protein
MSKVLLTAILILAYTGVDAQIVADHNAVDEFDNIPQVYLDMVKTMLDLIPEPGKQTIKIDLSQQSPGLYFIKVIFIDHTLVKQAIISN